MLHFHPFYLVVNFPHRHFFQNQPNPSFKEKAEKRIKYNNQKHPKEAQTKTTVQIKPKIPINALYISIQISSKGKKITYSQQHQKTNFTWIQILIYRSKLDDNFYFQFNLTLKRIHKNYKKKKKRSKYPQEQNLKITKKKALKLQNQQNKK